MHKCLWVSWGKPVDSGKDACEQLSGFVHTPPPQNPRSGITARLVQAVYTFCVQLLPQQFVFSTPDLLLFSPFSTRLIKTTTTYIN